MDRVSRQERVGHQFLALTLSAAVLGAALTLRAAGVPQTPPAAPKPATAPPAASRFFETDVRDVLERNCSRCHDAQHPTAGMIVATYEDPASLASHRDGWELILERLQAGEMPPPGESGPTDDEVSALVSLVQ